MSGPQIQNQPPPVYSSTRFEEGNSDLNPDSYTAQRLEHASPKHLHLTTRRTFIGPLPRGWLQSHRKSWYKKWLGLKDYSSKAATFSADTSLNHTNQRQLTGFLGAETAAIHRQSFPQPEDVFDDESPVEATPIAPIDTSREEPRPEQHEERTPPGQFYDGQNDGIGDTAASPRPSSVSTRTSSTDHAPVEYFTAKESLQSKSRSSFFGSGGIKARQPDASGTNQVGQSQPEQSESEGHTRPDEVPSSPSANESAFPAEDTSSAAALIPHNEPNAGELVSRESTRRLQEQATRVQPHPTIGEGVERHRTDQEILSRATSGMVRFDGEASAINTQHIESQPSRPRESLVARSRRPPHIHDGEVIRAERMLVRIDTTQQSLPVDFSENDSLKIETRISEKWREFLVVCRQRSDEDTPFTLHLYKTRVIPQVQISQIKKNSSHEIPLTLTSTNVNLFSSLDKTIVLWHPQEGGTRMYIMRTRSASHSMEWYTFLRTTLGWKRPTKLTIQVPDLNVALLLNHPFAQFETNRELREEENDECSQFLRTMAQEKAAAAGLIRTCMNTLLGCPEWVDILNEWSASEKMGLAWRRYDRLEWVHGANEERMYGTIAMRTSHELELRPKHHYPTSIKHAGEEELEEPPPIEGFLILLTSQKGKRQRLGKSYSRRLYFTTQNEYLCFSRPGRASPPPPPRLPTIAGSNIPSASRISKEAPIIYPIDPYPLKDGKIPWLSREGAFAERHDIEAYGESRRNLENLERAEGYFNLCKVSEVRVTHKSHLSEDSHLNAGDVEFHDEVRDTTQREGIEHHHQSQASRSFELVMNDGLVVKFRAYNLQTRDEWVKRLSDLVRYWVARTRDDIATMKSIRQQNLDQLNITEDQESMFGQFAQKWEVSKALASPHLFNICGISGCRAVKMSGNLYCKPRRRSTFTRCSVILTEGQILTFQSFVRKFSGEQTPHTHHEREWALDLRDCYIYSGLITGSDLLYETQTVDSSLPGHHTSPRIYTSDGWTSSDEDIATCFVVWHNTRKTVFRSQEQDCGGAGRKGGRVLQTKWKRVSALGVPGRSIVFMARSRTERDLWMLAIETEIDRLQQREDVRIVSRE
ncbi:hypothetical protein FQN51_001048 [Onygenales sp. PD_10]|nr:hypothetical protein FQN51_001048 [Onygenales sp. PD_10]